ncbi:leukocyte-associated immunoglobulin-like receptor 1 isoform X1 [Octodon degus]|uniref:Leukocyte-associated immunoglobulin-like receptor 1 isoform X1 n=1 Tax=Octodon degus TaxID=10160 RepID=A0A6P6DWF9_OCTDE|nr:leukocyte-associated immunoglobulin-like receptor 1 isoform X1 [Octodon degus]
MPPQPISLLVLGPLPAPSITAELGSMTSGGRAVTIMCQAQGSIERFRLEKCSAGRCSAIIDYTTTSFSENEARFYLTLTNAGQYSCMYQNSSMWSSRSEILELAVTGGDVTQTVQSPTSALPSDLSPEQVSPPAHHRASQSPRQPHGLRITRWRISSGWAWLAWSWRPLGFCSSRPSAVREGPKRQPGREQQKGLMEPSERESLGTKTNVCSSRNVLVHN